MQSEKSALFKVFQYKSRFIAEVLDLFPAVNMHITVTCAVYDRHLDIVHKPSHAVAFGCHIPQYQPSVRTQNAADAVEEILHVGVVVETLTADDHIEGLLSKREIFAVAHHQFNARHVF